MKKKTCTKCGKERKAAEFPRSSRSRDRLSSWCKPCHLEATRRWRAEHREELNAARRVVPRYVYDPESKSTVPNPSTGPKSKVR